MSIELPNKLPRLRKELVITRGGTDFNDNPTWIIHDPHDNRFFHIGYLEYQIYSRWELAIPAEIVSAVNDETTMDICEEDIKHFLVFLSQNCLIVQSHKSVYHYSKLATAGTEESFFKKAAKNYVFFRIPLIHPDRFLTVTAPYIKWIFSKTTFYVMCILAFFCLYLFSRQWDTFITTFSDILNWQGAFLFAIALIISKLFHEFGHAYQCKLNGVKVPTMGVAFMLLWPLLYTDTSESWKIPEPKKRLAISIAGMQMEIYLAVIASLLWNFVPDGPARTAIFFIAAASWIVSLFINLSPFLRFDGYHVLSDLLGARNLQTRSFKVTKWWIRELLFGLNHPMPEPLNPKQKRTFIIYAILTWLYRFFLFLAIALLIYHFFFKLLGILLFIFEVYLLIALPIFREIKVWWHLRHEVSVNRNIGITVGFTLLVGAIFFTPWYSTLRLPATLSYQYQSIFSPEGAELEAINIHNGDYVKQGQKLVQLNSPEIDVEIKKTQHQIEQIKWQLRSVFAQQKDLQNLGILQRELARAKTKLLGLEKQHAKLKITAPHSGYIANLETALHPGRWVAKNQLLMTIINPENAEITAFVSSRHLNQITINQEGKFIPENINKSKIKGLVVDIDYQQSRQISAGKQELHTGLLGSSLNISLPAYHASVYGGQIPVRMDAKNNLIPESSVYRIILMPTEHHALQHVERGTVFMNGAPQSLASRLGKLIGAVFIRESGF